MASSHPIRSRLLVGGGVLILALSSVAFVSSPVQNHLRAAALLLRIADPQQHQGLANYGTHSVRDSEIVFFGASPDPIHARLYVPHGVTNPPGMVVVHGVHHLGMNEPRLVNFARAFAASGVAILTPELPGIADYHVDLQSIEVIGKSAHEMRQRLHTPKVGVMGLSFSGGLSLLAATNPEFAPDISYVVAVGAHDDLSRVSRFFINNQIFRPDGSVQHLQAHDYGALVLVYSHLNDFFSPADIDDARLTLRSLLYEDVTLAQKEIQQLSPQGRAKMQLLFDHKINAIAPELLKDIDAHQREMTAVSPAGKLSHLKADVLLLHGAGDDVIPASETLWLTNEVPPEHLKNALITPVLSHVDMTDGPSVADRARVVHFIAQMLEEARESNHDVSGGPSRGGIGGDFYFHKKELVVPAWSSDTW
jgi:pimeloyl-ACP methyl ester carboxylesterase